MEKSENCNEFDALYADLCNSLRKMGKAASFCQLIKNATSDLKRIAILNNDCNIVPSLIKTIKKCRKSNSKDSQLARESLEAYYANKRGCDESANLIRLLNSALSHLHIDDQINFEQFANFDSNGIMFLENFLIDGDESAGSDENLLLSEVYRERANCFYDMGHHKMSILESVRAIHYAKFNRNNPHEHLFSILFRIATALRHLNQWKAATNIIQFSIKLLRSSHLDNAVKSVETMRLVKLLKEIQIMFKGSKELGEEDDEKPLKPKNEKFPEIFQSISSTMVNTSSSLQLKYDENIGRHLISTETIPSGNVFWTSFKIM